MAAEILILSSSPPRQFATYGLSSSPPLPSMDGILQKQLQALRNGSLAAPIPQNASASFTSAASLLKSASSIDAIGSFPLEDRNMEALKPAKAARPRKAPAQKGGDETKPTKKPRKPAQADGDGDTEVAKKKPSKPRVKKADEGGENEDSTKQSVAPKSRAKKGTKEASGDELPKEKPSRKPRAKKAEGELQTKLSKGKVTKISTTAEAKLVEAPKSKVAKPATEPQEFDLPKALKRRVDWTPPLPSEKTAVPASDIILSSGGILSGEKRNGFADIFGNYGFTKLDNSSACTPVGTEIMRKRKLIELVRTSVATEAAASPKPKGKAPKKKARTITDQATSAYAEEEELPAQPAPLLQYFTLETSDRSTSEGFKVPPKPRSKSPTKGSSKAKKGSAQAPILLSPKSAMKEVGNQDFVFGTSSQLAREDSPTLLRDLQAAMQASNEEDDPFASAFDSSPPRPSRRTGLTTKRNLWSAASRDDTGNLLDVPMIDLVDSPVVDKQLAPAATETPLQAKYEVWHDIGPTPAAKATSDATKILRPIEAVIRDELLSNPLASPRVRSPKKIKATGDGRAPDTKLLAAKSRPPAKAKRISTQMPNFSAYTDTELAKEIASYRFKPIKKRDQMITLLERCWESKNQPPLSDLSTNLPLVPTKTSKDVAPPSSQMPKAVPRRPRGRPRKENTIQFLDMDSDTSLSQTRTPKKSQKQRKQTTEDISDSDEPFTPSPPRRSASQITPLPLRPSTSNMSDSPELSPGAAQELLFKHISRAVTSAPRSKEPLNPSWHEKIILYDPIVLEDLTIWLNTGALENVGWDGEVDPKLVKKWCESKSICCLWRENLRGGARSRY